MSRERGFSVVELLISITVSMVLFAAFGGFYLSQQHSFAQGWIDIDTSETLRTALDQMVRDLRSAGFDPTGAGSCGFLVADANRVEFLIDADPLVNAGCDATSPSEHRGFWKDGTTIKGYVGGVDTWEPLAENVSTISPLFSYYRDDGVGGLTPVTALPASPADRALIKRVDVTVPMSRNAPLGRLQRTEATSAMVRNKTL